MPITTIVVDNQFSTIVVLLLLSRTILGNASMVDSTNDQGNEIEYDAYVNIYDDKISPMMMMNMSDIQALSVEPTDINVSMTSSNCTCNFSTHLFFYIHTADVLWAGTDSIIAVSLYGDDGRIPRRQFDPIRTLGHNAFERDQYDVVIWHTNINIGTIQWLELHNDGTWLGSAWKPNCIYLFGYGAQMIDEWISKDKSVTIRVTKNDQVCF